MPKATHAAPLLSSTPRRPALLRLLAYVEPYVPLILLSILLTFVVSAGHYGRAYLMKPVLDDIVLPATSLNRPADTSSWLPSLPIPGLPARLPEDDSVAGEAPPGSGLDEAARARLETHIRARFVQVVLLAIAIIVGVPLATLAREYLVAYVMGRINLDLTVELCRKLLILPLRFHRDRRRGDVLTRLMGDVGAAQACLSLLFGDFIQAAVMILVGGFALLFVSWKLSLGMVVIGPLIFAVMSVFGRRIRNSARRRQEKMGDVNQRLVEILVGIKVIKAFRAEEVEAEGFRRESRKLFRRGMKVVTNRVLARSLVDMLNNTAGVAILIVGVLLVLGGHWGLTAGDLAAFAFVTVTIYRPVKAVARGWVRLMDAQPSAERFFELLDSPVEIDDAPDAVRIGRLAHGVRLADVCFSYGREPVLRNLHLEVNRGDVVAIVGRTGAGKTTLIDLLLRFYDPTSGVIEIDGVDLRRVERDSLLDQIAVVNQEPFLFDGSIAENIRYGRPGASDEEVLAAARAAHVDEFAGSLPEGYATEVGAEGARLSGGQRQRITIARALLKDPAILIFDEATSSLDAKSERYVQEAIEALLGGRTVFIIAHRLSTIRRADKIVVLEGGAISEIGTHQELFEAGGLYRELVELQTTPSRRPSQAPLN